MGCWFLVLRCGSGFEFVVCMIVGVWDLLDFGEFDVVLVVCWFWVFGGKVGY